MSDVKKNIAPVKLELLFAIVHNSKQAYFSSLIQSRQANLQVTMPCKGTTHLILGTGRPSQNPGAQRSSLRRSRGNHLPAP